MDLVGFLLGEVLVAVVWFFFVIIKEIAYVFLVFLVVCVLRGLLVAFVLWGLKVLGCIHV